MKLCLDVALDSNNLIGDGNKLPWPKNKRDMEHFRQNTIGHLVVMGRKTWESIPDNYRPLSDRTNLVLTSDVDYIAEGATVVHNKEEIQRHFKNHAECHIIGGRSLFEMFSGEYDVLNITKFVHEYDGDVYFPNDVFDASKYKVFIKQCFYDQPTIVFLKLERK